MQKYFYRVNKNSFSFNLINDSDEKHGWQDRYKWSHYPIMHRLLNFMGSRGFEIGRDPEIQKHYKSLDKDRWYGKKGDLEFVAKRYPRGFEFEFYQNIVFKNSNGGKYDFDKFEKAPYLIKLQWINETKKMGEFLKSLGVADKSNPILKTAEDKIKYAFVESWHHPQKDMNFNLTDLDGTACESSYNSMDRDKKTILNGQVKYFRYWNGRLMRGKVYHNINNMWWVILNDTEYTNIDSFELFDPTEEDFKLRRKARDRKPKEYLEKLENMKQLSNKELLRELKKRGIKVS